MTKLLLGCVFGCLLVTPEYVLSQWDLQNRGVFMRDIDFATSNTAVAVGDDGWILRTSDAGETWRMNRATANILHAIEFFNEKVGWIVGGNGTILKTTDGGTSWFGQYAGVRSTLTSVHFGSETLGWVAGDSGCVLKTTNGGDTWVQVSNTSPRGGSWFLNRIAFSTNTQGWVAYGLPVVQRSTDGGSSWVQTRLSPNVLNIQFVDSLVGWIFADTALFDYSREVLLKTTDGGETWFDQPYPYLDTGSMFWGSMFFLDRSYGWVPRTSGGIRRTTDGGSTWTKHVFATVGWITSIKFINPQVGLLVSEYTLLKTSDEGSTWNTSFFGTGNTLFSVDFVDSSWGWAVGDGTVILHTSNGGKSWQAERGNSSIGIFEAVSAVDRNIAYAVGNDRYGVGEGMIFKTSDGGSHWVQQNGGKSAHLSSVHFLGADTGWACGISGNTWKMLRTTNGGEIWDMWDEQRPYRALQFLNGSLGYAIFNETVDRTTDGGLTWSSIGWAPHPYLQDVFFLNSQLGWVVGDSGMIWKTTDAGNLWFPQTSHTTETLTKVKFVDSNVGWIASLDAILATTDGGATWVIQSGGVSGDSYYGLDAVGPRSAWVVGSNGSILALRDSVSSHDSITKDDQLPKQFILYQNYPNPFNPTTTIRYSLASDSHVTLRIFNVLGKDVASFVEGKLSSGEHSISWKPVGLPSGVYFYRVETDGFWATKKMIFLK